MQPIHKNGQNMEKDKIFFAEQGLTSTSANYCANLAKEAYQASEKRLQHMQFYTSSCCLIGSSDRSILREGCDTAFVREIEQILDDIGRLKSLIAWLREALKAKDILVQEARKLSDYEICKVLGIEYPDAPEKYMRLSDSDVIASWNIKQRNRYFWLETMCATIGEAVHPNGSLSEARNRFFDILSEPNQATGSGRDTVVYHYEPTVSKEELDAVYFRLQQKYREFQAELNSMKHDIELARQHDDREKQALEVKESHEYASKMRIVSEQCAEYRKKAVADAQALKITIPDALRDTYKRVSETGKE